MQSGNLKNFKKEKEKEKGKNWVLFFEKEGSEFLTFHSRKFIKTHLI